MSCKKTLTKNASIVHLSFVFFFNTGGTAGIHKFLGFS